MTSDLSVFEDPTAAIPSPPKEVTDYVLAIERSKVPALADQFAIFTTGKDGESKFKGIHTKLLSEYIINKHHILIDKNIFYRYVDGIYKCDEGESVNTIVEDIMGEYANIHSKREILTRIRDTSRIQLNIDELPLVNNNLIAFSNGVYNRDTHDFTGHSPDNFLMSKLPVKYDPDAVSVDAKQMMLNIFGDDFEDELEYLGYALTNTNWLDKISFYVGDGSNGRTYYMKWLNGFFGPQNCAATDPHELASDRFAGVDLVGKQVCLVPDVGAEKITNFHKLKQYSTIDVARVQEKGGKAFNIRLYAKFFYGCNEMPYITDKTYGSTRRQRIVVLRRLFSSSDVDYDPKIADRAMKPVEYSGMVNILLPALERLTERGRFREQGNIAEFSHKLSRVVYAFTEECIEVTGVRQDRVLVSDVLDLNEAWCKLNGFPIPDRASYSEKFTSKHATKGVMKIQTSKKGVRGTYMLGIKQIQTSDGLYEAYGVV